MESDGTFQNLPQEPHRTEKKVVESQRRLWNLLEGDNGKEWNEME